MGLVNIIKPQWENENKNEKEKKKEYRLREIKTKITNICFVIWYIYSLSDQNYIVWKKKNLGTSVSLCNDRISEYRIFDNLLSNTRMIKISYQ